MDWLEAIAISGFGNDRSNNQKKLATSVSASEDRPAMSMLEALESRQLMSTVYVSSGGSVDAAAAKAGDGGTVILHDGTFKGGIHIEQDDLTITAEHQGKAIIDGTGYQDSLVAWGGHDVTVKGITFRYGGQDVQDNTKAPVRTGNGWTVQDCIIEKTKGVGLGMFGKNVTVLRVTSQDNGRAGIGGSGVVDGLLKDSISRRNNIKNGDNNGGGGKFTRVNRFVVDGYKSYDNTGVGLWFDYNNIDVTVRNSEVHDNNSFYRDGKLKAGGAGIFFEVSGIVSSMGSSKISDSGSILIENNHVWGNSEQGVQIWGTQNVDIRNNLIENNTKAQVMLRGGRPSPYATKNVDVYDNVLNGTKNIGVEDSISYKAWNND